MLMVGGIAVVFQDAMIEGDMGIFSIGDAKHSEILASQTPAGH